MFGRSNRANFTPDRSIPLEPVRISGSSYTRLLSLDNEGNENDSSSITNYELGFEDEPKVYDDDSSSCSDTSSMLERRMGAMAFGIMFPVSLVFGGCLRKAGKRFKRKFMMKVGKKCGRRTGTCSRQSDADNAGPFGDHHDIDGLNALSTGIDHIPARSSMEISPAPAAAPYRPLTISDVAAAKRDWKTNAKQEWRRRRAAMVDGDH